MSETRDHTYGYVVRTYDSYNYFKTAISHNIKGALFEETFLYFYTMDGH
jgi:hypothetical protein